MRCRIFICFWLSCFGMLFCCLMCDTVSSFNFRYWLNSLSIIWTQMKTEQAGNDTQIKRNQVKGASCPEKKRKKLTIFLSACCVWLFYHLIIVLKTCWNVTIFPSACCIWLLYQLIIILKRYHFCFNSALLRVQPCWFSVYQWRAEKGWLTMYLILLPHMLALFIRSPIQVASSAQCGCTHSHAFMTFRRQCLTNWMRNQV